MTIVKGFLALLWLLVIPLGVGLLLLCRRKGQYGVGTALVFGYCGIFAMSEILFLGAIVGRVSLDVLVVVWGILTGVAALLGLVLDVLSSKRRKPDTRRKMTFSWEFLLALALIAAQVLIAVVFTHYDADDAFYVGTATTAMETNTVFQVNPYTGTFYKSIPSRYILSPFPILLAVVGKLCLGLHPSVVAHIFLPLFLIPLAYLVYGLLGKAFFPEDGKAQGTFLLFMAVIQMSSYFSVYTQGTFLLVRIWQGKAVLASILLPVLMWFCLEMFWNQKRGFLLPDLLMVMTACCFVSSMGMILAPVMLGCFLLLAFLTGKQRKRSLLGLLCCLPNVFLGLAYVLIR